MHNRGLAWSVCAAALVFAAALASSREAVAQPMSPEAMSGQERQAESRLTLGLSGAKIREDWYLRLTVAFGLTIPNVTLVQESPLFDRPQTHDLRLRFYAPFAFLVRDNPPQREDGRVFRREDWDEPAEYFRILRSIEYATPYDGIYFRGGELSNVRIGHRTIVDNYINSLDVDSFRWGLHANLNTVHGGTETLIDNITGPRLMGTRLYVRPWSFIDPSSFWNRLAFGISLFGDVAAPAALQTTIEGTYVADARGRFVIERADPTGVLGFDAELTVVQTDVWTVTPYTDVNSHLGRGTGWHVGSFYGFRATPELVLDLRTEYRLLGRNYLPSYFGPLYEIERFAYLPVADGPTRLPKLQWLRTGQENSVRSGYLMEAGIALANLIRVAAAWESYRGKGNSTAWIYATVPALKRVQFAAYYANTRFHGARGLFDLDNALLIGEARVMLTSWLWLGGSFNRRWQLDTDGDYRPVDDFSIGAGVSFGL